MPYCASIFKKPGIIVFKYRKIADAIMYRNKVSHIMGQLADVTWGNTITVTA